MWRDYTDAFSNYLPCHNCGEVDTLKAQPPQYFGSEHDSSYWYCKECWDSTLPMVDHQRHLLPQEEEGLAPAQLLLQEEEELAPAQLLLQEEEGIAPTPLLPQEEEPDRPGQILTIGDARQRYPHVKKDCFVNYSGGAINAARCFWCGIYETNSSLRSWISCIEPDADIRICVAGHTRC